MLTQCPHCETNFRVTETQIQVADGLVRCGICEEVFDAIKAANQHKHRQSLLSDKETVTKTQTSVEQSLSTDIDNELPKDEHIDAADFQNIRIETEPVEHSITSENMTSDNSSSEAFDLFDEENNESLQHVVPDKYRNSYSDGSQSITSTVLWGIAVLFLTTTLVIEYIWFNRNQFRHLPELQAVTQQLCKHIDCNNVSMRDPEKIELVTRNVYSHPNNKNALMINVTMTNKANFAQPHPVMQINFSDIRGGIVAARRFLPTEYISTDASRLDDVKSNLLLPNTSISTSLEILDPGKQAMTYEFSFL